MSSEQELRQKHDMLVKRLRRLADKWSHWEGNLSSPPQHRSCAEAIERLLREVEDE